MGSMAGSVILAIALFGLPYRGSVGPLAAAAALFLIFALGLGLFISTLARNQFVASQLAFLTTMMPAMMLSGMLFDIAAMPRWLQLVTYAVPARYLVSILQTLFLAGDVWAVMLPNLAGLGVAAILAVSATLVGDAAQARLMLRRILALIVKELVGLWKDPKTRVVILVPPLVQVVMFAYAATYDVTTCRSASGTTMPARNRPNWCVASLLRRRSMSLHPSRRRPRRAPRSTRSRSRWCCMCRRISPPIVLAGRIAQAQLLLDARRSNSALMAQGYAAAIVGSLRAGPASGPQPAARAADPRLVQSDAGEHVVHPARPRLHPVADHVAADQRAVAGARA